MSNTESRRIGEPKHRCQHWRDRKARFRYRGIVRADRDHTLCFECYRRERDRMRARGLAGSVPPQLPLSFGDDAAVLSERQIAHRRRMLEHARQSL